VKGLWFYRKSYANVIARNEAVIARNEAVIARNEADIARNEAI
jgi:hypothetical protein